MADFAPIQGGLGFEPDAFLEYSNQPRRSSVDALIVTIRQAVMVLRDCLKILDQA
jgi:hypothetical protein